MAMKKIPIADATAQQLRAFAREVLGLQEVKDNATKVALIALITPAWDQPHIIVEEADVDTSLSERRANRHLSEETPEDPEKATVIVNVHVVEEPGGDRPIELAVNGRNMLVPRGKDVELTWPYYDALRHAEQHFHDPMPVVVGADGVSGGINPIPRKVLRYPYSRVA